MKGQKKACKLELTWPGKETWERPEPRLLLEKSDYGTKKGAEENLLIYGDNLLGLKALERDYSGKVKCVYIDPPYNTKSCFTHYDDSMEHSLWLNMMKERLVILRRLLKGDGSIWISIDDSESHYLKVLCDEVFGRKNFIANVIWQKKSAPQNDAKWLSDTHDHILIYARDKSIWRPNRLPRTEEMNSRYKNPDRDHRGPWVSGDLTCNKSFKQRPNLFYEITDPETKIIYKPNPNRVWSSNEENMKRLIKDRRVIFPKKGKGSPMLKRFLLEVRVGVSSKTIWLRDEVGDNIESKREILSLNSKDVFPTPKPERLIERILHLASNSGDLILDCFAGSGTTGAVAHKMKRRWIMIEMNSHCQTHILPRLQKVTDGEEKGGITEAVHWKGGGGFRYCELAPSLLEKNKFNRWTISKKYNPIMLIEAMCLHAGYTFNPRREPWWMHGQSTENDYIYITASTLTRTQLSQMSHELEENQSLLVYCGAFKADPKEFENLTIKKIPKSILSKCEWGRDDYSLKIALQEEVKWANKKKPKKQQATSGDIIRMPLAAQGVRS